MPASGMTSTAILTELRAEMLKQYGAVVAPLPKSKRELAVDCFTDGFNTAVRQLRMMGVIEVVEGGK